MTSKTPAAILAMLMLAGTAGVAAAQTATPDAATAAQDAAQSAQDAAAAASDATAAAAEGATEAATAAADAATEAASNAQAAAQDAATAATAAPAVVPADGEPQPGQYYVKQSFDDWTLRCIKTQDNNDPCELYQLLKDGSGTSVAEFTLVPVRGGGEVVGGATVVTPLETDLLRGLGFQVDRAEPRAYPFAVCMPVGCVARLGLAQAEIDSMKRGNTATVSVLPFGQNPETGVVPLTVSLKGFTAGLTELEKVMPAQ